MNIIQQLEKEQLDKLSAGKTIPDFEPGDTVIVNVKVVEGERTRIQAYEGVCIGRSGRGMQRELHGPQDFLWRGRRARVPAAIRRWSTRSSWCAAARCAAPSCIICAACAASRRASPKARTTAASPRTWRRGRRNPMTQPAVRDTCKKAGLSGLFLRPGLASAASGAAAGDRDRQRSVGRSTSAPACPSSRSR